MYRIAIVEDSGEAAKQLEELLITYQQEHGVSMKWAMYVNALDFLEEKSSFDIVLMDIEMPLMSGMEAAREFRQRDREAIIIFITNMKQFAMEGYAVDALDYLLKPVSYPQLEQVIGKALRRIDAEQQHYIMLPSATGLTRIPVSDVLYVEIHAHKISWHLANHQMELWGTLKEVEEKLPPKQFARANSGVIVNLQYVEAIEGEDVIVYGEHIHVARTRKKELLNALGEYLGI